MTEGSAVTTSRSGVEHAVRSLRAVREYGDEPIGPATIERWIDAVRWCGSSRNGQPWRFVAVRDQKALHALKSLGDYASHLRDCAAAIVMVSRCDGPEFSRVFDLGRVSQSLMLIAAEDGFGSCVAVFEPRANMVRAGQLLGVPDDFAVDLAIGFGRPRRVAAPSPSPRPSPRGRRSVYELLSFDRFGNVPANAGPAGVELD